MEYVKDLAFYNQQLNSTLRSVFNFLNRTAKDFTLKLWLFTIYVDWNQSVHSLDKWYAKFRTDKFCPGIAFTICTNKFHFPKNDRKGLKMVSKMALKKGDTKFPFGIFCPE